ncbi:Aste57867_1821 [Aphanomyces stellatus]|uniref:Aste57867_1821 protein n=1 Tax=Aphanomyces stellatus TaxID=120398 RepID=A0A485KBQ7_9STRA|nr:hypothetical protein As57867_001819 [Aphanomyces stellatus]VFT79030.1 Aste57867_1821 [Aphanomyces stellatus]
MSPPHLPPNYFRCPTLSAYERETYLSFGEVACRDTVENALSIQNHRAVSVIKNKKTKQHAMIYAGKDVVDPSLPVLCAKTTIRGSLDDVSDFFFLDSPEKLSNYSLSMGQNVLDRQNLYTLARPASLDHPFYYCGIAWFAFETPLAVMANRDFCVIEYHNEIHYVDSHKKRRRGWVRCIQSIDLRQCPPLKASHGLVRGSVTRTGQVFLETDTRGVLDFYSVVVAQSCGTFQSIVTEVAKRQAVYFEEQLALFRLTRQKHFQFLSGQAFEHLKAATTCVHCERKFSWFNKKHHCRQCNEIVCSKCGHEWTIFRHERDETVFVCQPCFVPRDPATNKKMLAALSTCKVELLKKLASPFEVDHLKTVRESPEILEVTLEKTIGPSIVEVQMVTETQRNLTILLEYAQAVSV